MLDVVQSLWIGNHLSKMEQLTINSYLKNGHEFHLYTYGHVEGVPAGAKVLDGSEIIPERDIFQVRDGYSTFSDFFRWKLILDRGGFWCDTDAVCLKPFDFPGDYMFTGGYGPPGSDDCVSSGVFKAPAGSAFLRHGWKVCERMHPYKSNEPMAWGALGPPLITRVVHSHNLLHYIVPAKLFFPVFWNVAPEAFLKPDANLNSFNGCYSVHFFNELWRLAGKDKDADYPKTSLYEQLKARYLCSR